jgi:hypothetical protein
MGKGKEETPQSEETEHASEPNYIWQRFEIIRPGM